MTRRAEGVVGTAVLLLFALVTLLPVAWLLMTALSPNLNGDPDLTDPRPGNFVRAWVQADFTRHLLVSVGLCVTVVVVVCVITPLAAYALTILRMPGARFVFPVLLAGIMIPLEGIIVPLYFTFRSLDLTGSLLGLVLAHIGLSVSFGVFWIRAALLAVPGGLVEAAQLDGAGRLATLRLVVLPVVKPALVTLALLTFMWTWNDFFLAFVMVNDPDTLPVTVALGAFSTKYTNQVNLMSAAAVLISLPVLVLYAFFQRHFIRGVLSGAIKG